MSSIEPKLYHRNSLLETINKIRFLSFPQIYSFFPENSKTITGSLENIWLSITPTSIEGDVLNNIVIMYSNKSLDLTISDNLHKVSKSKQVNIYKPDSNIIVTLISKRIPLTAGYPLIKGPIYKDSLK